MDATGPTSFSLLGIVAEEVILGEVRWVRIRARGAEWSWLTPDEAVAVSRYWIERLGNICFSQIG